MNARERAPAAADAPAPGRARATKLGYAGLVPPALLALWLAGIPADHIWRDMTIRLLIGYSAIVLAFLGGARWGAALRGDHPQAARDVALAVVPALLGWGALFIRPAHAFVLLAVAFAAQGAWDALSGQTGALPPWFASLRVPLTVAAVLAMVVAFVATAAG